MRASRLRRRRPGIGLPDRQYDKEVQMYIGIGTLLVILILVLILL